MSSHAIILAAGNGKRMGQLTADRPKAMLDVNGSSLIDRQIEALERAGIDDITIVAGYQHHRLREHLGERVRFVENERYASSNSLYSLWLVRDWLANGSVVMNADILVSRELIARLVSCEAEDALLIDRRPTLGAEEMKVKVWQGFVIDFSKDMPVAEADGENVGILKFGAEGGRRLTKHIESLIDAGQFNAWAPLAFRALAQEWPLRAVETANLPWTEIDFPEDLDRARREVAPAMLALRSSRKAA